MPRHRLEDARQHPFDTLTDASQLSVLRAWMRHTWGSRMPADRVYRSERPRCGARCRDGHPCQAPAMLEHDSGCYVRNGRCRMHGGLSTGPKTEAGRQRVADAARQRLLARHAARIHP